MHWVCKRVRQLLQHLDAFSKFLPCHNSNGVLLDTADVGHLFQTWTSAAKHSAQNLLDKPDSSNISVILSDKVLFARSATPSCWGLFRTVCCLMIPQSSVNRKNAFDMYSPPLSSLNALTASSTSMTRWSCSIGPFSHISSTFLVEFLRFEGLEDYTLVQLVHQ